MSPPSTVVASDENSAQVEAEANMETENLGEFNANNSSNLKIPSIMPDML